ncbi:MAG: glycosyltransferase family 39 protein [Candidatus Diapherotrites archaeon]|uniref:Glycosyltransferase family 39 protein n=1 Tax=Candidatus Iainarchaeum sp. TaxID=3101447 RepID=A0A7J4IQH9_9ARCH|nr:MAG: hypothetical protein QT03_C0001G0598 [archaeon GW2011_AR10]MBS3059649.1 glycosyltransferase family 39 protein [Candidatus Diapherotrites archaeon]HIH07753.1 glycosyltransferase family 39 protein [Candidatus Diapherotrites archaeon]
MLDWQGTKKFVAERKELFILLVTALVLYSVALNDSVDGGDAAQYLVAGKALAEGKGYADVSFPGNPSFAYYPPAYPAIISAVFLLFGQNFVAVKFLSVLFAVFSVFISYLIFLKFFEERMSFLISAALAFNLLLLWYSHRALTETFYLFVSISAIYLLLSYLRKEPFPRYNFVAGTVLVVVAFFTKTIGAALGAAAAGVFFGKKEFKKSLILLLILLSFVIFWAYYISSVSSETSSIQGSYFSQFLLKDLDNPQLGNASIFELGQRAVSNFSYYAFVSIPQAVFPLLDIAFFFSQQNIFLLAVAAAIGLIFLLGYFSSWARSFNLIHLYIALYFLVLLFWPYADTSAVDRFLLPVLPFLLMFFVRGLMLLPIEAMARKEFIYIVLVTGIVASLASDAFYLSSIHERQLSPEYKEFVEAANWLKENSAGESVVLTNESFRAFLLSGRKTVQLEESSLEELNQKISRFGVDFILLAPFDSPFKETVEKNAAEFQLIFEGSSGKTRVFRVASG